MMVDGEGVVYCTIYPCLADMAESTEVKGSGSFQLAGRGLLISGSDFQILWLCSIPKVGKYKYRSVPSFRRATTAGCATAFITIRRARGCQCLLSGPTTHERQAKKYAAYKLAHWLFSKHDCLIRSLFSCCHFPFAVNISDHTSHTFLPNRTGQVSGSKPENPPGNSKAEYT
jgi:hypothetical protein